MKHDIRIEEIRAENQRQRVPGLHDIEIISSLGIQKRTEKNVKNAFSIPGNRWEIPWKLGISVYILPI